MKFKISSALKDIIGRELITNDLVAIFELVKNGYDAGAKNVKIIFENVKSETNKKSKIYIVDDGSGMSKEDIEKKWLFVGYSEKKFSEKELKDFRNKYKEKRIFAGAKGVGRFSCDRLGSKLHLYTKSNKNKNYNVLDVDWNKFQESQDTEFQTIEVTYSQSTKKHELLKSSSGTVLEITDLNDTWDLKKLRDLKKYLQRLINPNQVSTQDSFVINLEAKEFTEDDKNAKNDFYRINGDIQNIVYEKLKIKTTMVSVELDSDGKQIKSRLEDKGNFIFELNEENNFESLKNIKVKISYLNRAAKTNFTRLMGIEPVGYGNIFVFKNGIRVLPYGEEGDDWLGLDKRKSQGYARFLGTRELLGRIEIDGFQPDLREVSSRSEGLVKTKSYYQLIDFVMKKVIRVLERYVVEAIDWDAEREDGHQKSSELVKLDTLNLIREISGGKLDSKDIKYNENFLEIYKEKEIEKIPEIIKNIEHKISSEKKKGKKDFLSKELKKLKESIKYSSKKSKKEIDLLKKQGKELEHQKSIAETQNLFLKSVQSQSFEQILSYHHHIKTNSEAISNYLIKVFDEMKKENLDLSKIIKYLQSVNYINNQIHTISNVASKGGVTENLKEKTVDLVLFFYEYLENICEKYVSGIKVDLKSRPDFSFNKKIKPFEITYLIDSFISNSKKAGAKSITFNFSIDNKDLLIEIYDDGKGLSNKIKNPKDIFEPGITTTRGSGLGLYDVSKIVTKLDGTVEVIDEIKKGIKFNIRIKK
jgi:hypothetical protein